MEVKECHFENENKRAWDAYVFHAVSSSFAHLSAWKAIVEESYGQETFFLCAYEGETIKGVLSLVYLNSLCFGKQMVSLPYLDEAGICADDDITINHLYQRAIELAQAKGTTNIEFRHRFANQIELSSFGDKVTLELKIPDTSEDQWTALDAKVRNQVRKAWKAGLTTEWAGLEALDEFYSVFAINMRDLASPVHSKKFFKSIFTHFSDGARLILVKNGQRTVAAGVCLMFKETLFMPWASSLREFKSSCPNVLLYWEVIRWSCDNGFKTFNFGRSTKGGGTYKFKKQWGAEEQALHWQRSKEGISTLSIQKEDPKYQWAMKAWRKLPIWLTNSLGPLIRGQMSH